MREKRIVCFGDSNTWGYDVVTNGRFGKDVRYTGILQNLLEEYIVVEEGLKKLAMQIFQTIKNEV